jgi:Uma2 family endonuclease
LNAEEPKMSIATDVATPERVEPATDVPCRLTVEEFYQMIDSGVFAPERRVYLWDGRIYEAMAKTIPHAVSIGKVLKCFYRILPAGWEVWAENPITVAGDKAPLPDVAIIRGSLDEYSRGNRRPGPADFGLVVEIAKSSVRTDTGSKLEAYARAGLQAYWVINLVTRHVMACSAPRVEDGVGIYGSVTTHAPDEAIPLVLDGREIARVPVRDLLDPEPTA